MIKRYKKKPVVIGAVQWDGFNLEEVKNFVGKDLSYEIFDEAWKIGAAIPRVILTIHTLEGDHIVRINDYIIKGVHGEFYPCKPAIFAETYEDA